MSFRIVRRSDHQFDELWTDLRRRSNCWSALYTSLDLEYQSHYPDTWQPEDHSFLIADQAGPISGVLLSFKSLTENLVEVSGYGRPILYLQDRDVNGIRMISARRAVEDELRRIFDDPRVGAAIYRSWENYLDPVASFLMERGAHSVPVYFQVVDLRLTESELHSRLRKRYKGLINNGLREFKVSVVDSTNLSREVFDEFRSLHRKAAGRVTRSLASWEVNFKILQAGEAFLVTARLEGRLVSCSFFDVACGNSCYRISASDRDLFDRPVNHCVMWTGLLEAKRRGASFMELGHILFPTQPYFCGSVSPEIDNPVRCPTPKEVGISTFKRGFGGLTMAGQDIWWRRAVSLPVPETEETN